MSLTPIAHWNVVPYQRITEITNIGVVAFSASGISSVDFIWNSGEVSEITPPSITTIELNSNSNTWEYHAVFDPTDFADIGVTLDCVVSGTDGGIRTLSQLSIVSSSGTNWQTVNAWVDGVGGGTPTASPSETGANPFQYVSEAADAIKTYRSSNYGSNNADGGMIYCFSGSHSMGDAGVDPQECTEWCTVTRDQNTLKENAVLTGGDNSITKLRLFDISSRNGVGTKSGATGIMWFDSVACSGNGMWNNSSPINIYTDNVYMTDTTVDNYEWGGGEVFVRGCTFTNIGQDVLRHSNLVVNTNIDNVYPGPYNNNVNGAFIAPDTLNASNGNFINHNFASGDVVTTENITLNTGPFTIAAVTATGLTFEGGIVDETDSAFGIGTTRYHSDVLQYYSTTHTDPVILYGLKFTNVWYQGIFWRASTGNDTPLEGLAIVNCVMFFNSATPYGGPFATYRSCDHMLMYHTSVGPDTDSFSFYDEPSDTGDTLIPNIDVRNSLFGKVIDNEGGGNINLTDWYDNHYVGIVGNNVVTPGSTYTTGVADTSDLDGVPNITSTLNDSAPRLTQVPADINGQLRDATTAKGAYVGFGEGALTPIARWNFVPYQRIETSKQIGVVAFSKAGISGVQFDWGSGTITPTDITSPTHNSESDTWEYWATFNPTDFSDGSVTLDATVFGNDSGTNVLDTLTVYSNSNDTLAQLEVWVSPTGNDSTGTVDNQGLPFLTIGEAAQAIDDSQGDTDGGMIYLESGTYGYTHGGNFSNFTNGGEWLTLTAASGEDNTTAILSDSGADNWPLDNLCIRNIKLITSAGNSIGFIACWSGGNRCWIDSCDCECTDAEPLNGNTVIDTIKYTDKTYFTNTTATGWSRTFSDAALVRGCTVAHDFGTPFTGNPLACNVKILKIDPEEAAWSGFHPDFIAYTSNSDFLDVIYYNVVCLEGHYAGGFFNDPEPRESDARAAFVNVYFCLKDTVWYDGGLGGFLWQWYRDAKHLIMWHNTWRTITTSTITDGMKWWFDDITISNASIRNSEIGRQGTDGSQPIWTNYTFDKLHTVFTDTGYLIANATNVTTGADDIDDLTGEPQKNSVLNNRCVVMEQVPIDANNKLRNTLLTAVGAFRGLEEGFKSTRSRTRVRAKLF